jgi:uncharacterized repeat protein (TIGR03837 family)
MRWDLFCRVVDNFGDVGVCWRLARDLAARGETVRLWIDDASALAWMAPGGAAGVQVGGFEAAGAPGDVVIEAFGCDPPPAFVAAMAAASRPPLWINLEYLSGEDWVERAHGLPSPQANGLTKWFFFPGFTPRTGGLLREPGLLAEREAFDRAAWLRPHGWAGERVVALFCYDTAPAGRLLDALAGVPTLLLLAAGAPQQLVTATPPAVRAVKLPWLAQPAFDRLLWSADINFVRGEDSLVRAVWAGAPFVWQIYPQHDGVHARKLHALLGRMPPLPGLQALWDGWNGLRPGALTWPDASRWRAAAVQFRTAMAAREDLVSALMDFTRGKGASC